MLDSLKWRSVKLGQPPGSLVYAGRKRDFEPSLALHTYSEAEYIETCVDPFGERPELPDDMTHLLSLIGVHEVDVVKRIGDWFGLHPLVQEDILNTSQRPKCSDGAYLDGTGAFMVLKNLTYDSDEMRLEEEQVSIVWGRNLILAFQEDENDAWDGVVQRIRRGKTRIRKGGAPYLAIAMLDTLFDRYYEALARISEQVESLESRLEAALDEENLRDIYRLKRVVLFLRNAILPARDIVEEFTRDDIEDIPPDVRPYLHDVRDHARQVAEGVTTLHDMLAGMLDLHISLAGMRMNNVMQLLTLIATIFIPLTFIAGVYGMNFRDMPELSQPWGYPAVLALMAVIGGGMVWYFARKKWL